jgi:stress response protein YsnF
MADIDTVVRWRGRTVIDQNGQKIGKFEEIYLDADSQSPEWASVTTGLFGLRQTLIPLRGAQQEGDDLRVPFDKDQVKDAPNLDPQERLSPEEETVLYRHYGMEDGERGAPEEKSRPAAAEPSAAASPRADDAQAADRPPETAAAAPGGEASQPAPTAQGDEPAAADTAHRDDREGQDEPAESPSAREQEIPLDTEVGPRERVRLKKYVVTDEVTKTVPVEREEVRVEREPFESAQGGGAEDRADREQGQSDPPGRTPPPPS